MLLLFLFAIFLVFHYISLMEWSLLLPYIPSTISALSALVATVMACLSFNLNRKLIRQNSDRIALRVMPRVCASDDLKVDKD